MLFVDKLKKYISPDLFEFDILEETGQGIRCLSPMRTWAMTISE
jgi:hypothetical protein